METKVILLSILTALAIIGFRKAMQPGFILSPLREFIENLYDLETTFLKHFYTPLFLCEYCMSSIWTLSVHLIFWELNWFSAIFGILVTCGLITILNGSD